MSWVYVIVVVVALKHLVLMAIARRNTRKLLLRGGYEVGAGHYPVFVVIFTAWFLTMLIFVDPEEVVNPWWIIAYVVLQFFRVQTMMSLGKYWTERVITIPGAPLVKSGLYQFIRHPNYLIVIGEVISVPMTLNLWKIALVFSVLLACLLIYRIRIEDAALASRR